MKKERSSQSYTDATLKENQVNMLKRELYVYKDLEQDFFQLNGQVSDIEMKYAMVIDEKERTEGEWKKKVEINTNSVVQLKKDVENLKKSVEFIAYDVEKAEEDNQTLHKICENKERQIESLYIGLKELQKTHELQEDQNLCLEEDLKYLKLERNKLESEMDRMKKMILENSEDLKKAEKQVRQEETKNEKLSSMLYHVEKQNCQLTNELTEEEEKVKELMEKYKQLCHESEEITEEVGDMETEIRGRNKEIKEHLTQLSTVQNQNVYKARCLKELQKKLWVTEEELDEATRKKQQNKKMNLQLAAENEKINVSIDASLLDIMDLENVNGALQHQIEKYLSADEQARLLLDRRQKMVQLLENVGTKLYATSSTISHLR